MPSLGRDDFTAQFGANTSPFNKAVSKLERDTAASMQKIDSAVSVTGTAFAGLAVAVVATTASFVEFEKGLIGVQKTTNLSDVDTKALGQSLLDLSTNTPFAVNSLLEVAQAAGQLGITGKDNILEFTRVISELGVSSDLAGGEAATTLARILSLTGENVKSVGNLASAFVALGNTSKASESEIANLALEVGKSTSIFDIGGKNVTGIATALAELAIQGEIGGSVVGRAFIEIKNGIDAGGKSLEGLSRATGIAAEDLKGAFQKDATDVFIRFLGSVKDVVESGGNATAFIEDFGLKGAGVNKVIAPLALNVDTLKDKIELAGEEFSNATALTEEYRKFSESASSQLTQAKNEFAASAIVIGEKFAPTILSVSKTVSELVGYFADLDGGTVQTIASLTLAATAFAGVVTAVGLVTKGVLALRLAFLALSGASGPIGLIVTLVGASAAAITAFYASVPKEAEKSNKELLKKQEEANAASLLKDEESTKNRIKETEKLVRERLKILGQLDKNQLKQDEDAAKEQLQIEVAGLELISLQQQGAKKETIKLKEEEIASLETLQSLKKTNAEIAAKEEKTALELITQEKNKNLIEIEQKYLDENLEKQEDNSDDIVAEIGDFEERTLKLIEEQNKKKISQQEDQLFKINKQLNDLNVPGSYPDQERDLTNSLEKQGNATAEYYEVELEKRRVWAGEMDEIQPTGETTTTTTTTTTGTTGTTDTDLDNLTTTSNVGPYGASSSSLQNCASGWEPRKNPKDNLWYCVENCPDGSNRRGFNGCLVKSGNISGSVESQILSAPSVSTSIINPSGLSVLNQPTSLESKQGGSQSITVELSLKDSLVDFITAKQKENRDLGTAI